MKFSVKLLILASLLIFPTLGCGSSEPTVIQPLENDAELQSINDEMAEAANGDTEE